MACFFQINWQLNDLKEMKGQDRLTTEEEKSDRY